MTSITASNLEHLRDALAGRVITSEDPDFDTVRSVWNGEINRRPALVARCAGPADVREAIRFARLVELEISVRGGAHNFGGAAVGDDGLMIDLSTLRGVSVDPRARTVRVGGGATLADLDAATQEHGLAVPAGTISHTGIGGLTLGGGFGWLTNGHGLTCDNLLSAEVVTAGGDVLRASEDEHPDLFWALRGGGGNFGVVTEFEFRVYPVGPIIQMGLFFWDLDHGRDALRLAREIVDGLPTSMGALIAGLNAPPEPFVPEQHRLQPGYALILAGFGTEASHAAMAQRVRASLPPLFEMVTPMPYTQLQQLLDNAVPWGILAYEKAVNLESLSDAVIDVFANQLPGKKSPLSIVPVFPVGRGFHMVDDDATAFGGSRSTDFIFNIGAVAPNPELLAADRAWVRGFYDALLPHAMGTGSYVNFINDFGDDSDRVRASYGPAKYTRLARIKAAYDPDNIFHRNPNIKPAG